MAVRRDRFVALIASGGANVSSVLFALERLGVRGEVTTDAGQIRSASHVILPGVGAAGDAMARLRRTGLDRVIRELRQPVLGVCLGLQLFYEHSREDEVQCLGIFPGPIERLAPGAGLSIPHMGWNQIRITGDSPLLEGIDEQAWFYFVHSYAAPPGAATVATSEHGGEFTAIARAGNFHAAQFHPERSAACGARLLENFLALE